MLITGSTGPIHIATAVRTFAVGLYPPQSALSPTRWGPRGGANKLFVPSVYNVDGDDADCLEQVTVSDVAAYVLSKIESIHNTPGEKRPH
jgi:ADP-heptose:LPS heptosyltransferase